MNSDDASGDATNSEIARLRENLQMSNRLAATAGQENAVLRHKVSRLAADRQVLEWHLSAARGDVAMALALAKGVHLEEAPDELAEVARKWLLPAWMALSGAGLGESPEAPPDLRAEARNRIKSALRGLLEECGIGPAERSGR